MAIVVERERHESLHPTHAVAALGSLGWLAVAGAASMGAGAIHAAAIGVDSEHRQAVITFTIVAAVQFHVATLQSAEWAALQAIVVVEPPGELLDRLQPVVGGLAAAAPCISIVPA